jgi:hypothetical protein
MKILSTEVQLLLAIGLTQFTSALRPLEAIKLPETTAYEGVSADHSPERNLAVGVTSCTDLEALINIGSLSCLDNISVDAKAITVLDSSGTTGNNQVLRMALWDASDATLLTTAQGSPAQISADLDNDKCYLVGITEASAFFAANGYSIGGDGVDPGETLDVVLAINGSVVGSGSVSSVGDVQAETVYFFFCTGDAGPSDTLVPLPECPEPSVPPEPVCILSPPPGAGGDRKYCQNSYCSWSSPVLVN